MKIQPAETEIPPDEPFKPVLLKSDGFDYGIAIGIIALALGLEWYLLAPEWEWKTMLWWLPFIALAYWGAHVGLSFVVDLMNRRVVPHIVRLLDRW